MWYGTDGTGKQGEALRIIERDKRAEELLIEAQKRKERTIEWCDTVLSEYLSKQALLGNLNDKRFTFHWSYENEMKFASVSGPDMKIIEPRIQMSRKYDYADGKHSYCGDGNSLDTAMGQNSVLNLFLLVCKEGHKPFFNFL